MDPNQYSSNGSINPEVTYIYNSMNNAFLNPTVIVILVVVIVLYLLISMSLGNSNNSNNNSNDSESQSGTDLAYVPLSIVIGLFIVLAIINGMRYFFGINVIASISKLFSKEPQVDISVSNQLQSKPTTVPEIKLKKQVFNIPGNTYTYPDAKALCTAYNAKLANYSEIEHAYNEGAEWCNYGWSDGQMALFPTQPKTFDGLQKIEGHENDCGRPGINGGYMANPALKFGVNCYGYKPVMTSQEQDLMATLPHYPITMKDILFEKRVNYWKDKLTQILVSPFNYNTWSKI
jgi:hypothetical protein